MVTSVKRPPEINTKNNFPLVAISSIESKLAQNQVFGVKLRQKIVNYQSPLEWIMEISIITRPYKLPTINSFPITIPYKISRELNVFSYLIVTSHFVFILEELKRQEDNLFVIFDNES